MFFFSSRRRHTRWTGDWSSDVCSSDLLRVGVATFTGRADTLEVRFDPAVGRGAFWETLRRGAATTTAARPAQSAQIGRASCRERVWMWVGAAGVEDKEDACESDRVGGW